MRHPIHNCIQIIYLRFTKHVGTYKAELFLYIYFQMLMFLILYQNIRPESLNDNVLLIN
jgi:hypothetical protein